MEGTDNIHAVCCKESHTDSDIPIAVFDQNILFLIIQISP